MTKNTFDAMNAGMANSRAIIITHPKKEGRAEIVIKFPRDGAGRVEAWCADFFPADGCRGVQYGRAGGYGYDKQTAAMSGFIIDGHEITDHCGQDAMSAKLLKAWHRAKTPEGKKRVEDKARKSGYSFTNWNTEARKPGYSFTNWDTGDGWQSCYKLSGLDHLKALGYSIYSIG